MDQAEPTARYDRVADDFYQRVRDLVPRFFEARRTSMPAFAHQHSVLDVGHRRPAFNCLSEKLRQLRSVLYVEQQTRWANTVHAPPRVEINVQNLAVWVGRNVHQFHAVKLEIAVSAFPLGFAAKLDPVHGFALRRSFS